jgi:hypothetical protein
MPVVTGMESETAERARWLRYQGGFSVDVFEQAPLQDYLSSGIIFGWIGSTIRTDVLDELVEARFKNKGFSSYEIALWLKTKDGRWCSDEIEGTRRQPNEMREQLKIIDKYVADAAWVIREAHEEWKKRDGKCRSP